MNGAQAKLILLILVFVSVVSSIMVLVLAPVVKDLALPKRRRDIAEIAQLFFILALMMPALPFTLIVILRFTWSYLGWLTNTLAYLSIAIYIGAISLVVSKVNKK